MSQDKGSDLQPSDLGIVNTDPSNKPKTAPLQDYIDSTQLYKELYDLIDTAIIGREVRIKYRQMIEQIVHHRERIAYDKGKEASKLDIELARLRGYEKAVSDLATQRPLDATDVANPPKSAELNKEEHELDTNTSTNIH